jgi:hypothetical protein
MLCRKSIWEHRHIVIRIPSLIGRHWPVSVSASAGRPGRQFLDPGLSGAGPAFSRPFSACRGALPTLASFAPFGSEFVPPGGILGVPLA